jgi:LytS/YehU family sensor histidine kinase
MRVILGLFASFLVAYPFLYIILFLNKIAPWGRQIIKRILIQLFFIIVISIIISSLITLFVKWGSQHYSIDFMSFINNAMIYSVANVILVIILEAWIFFVESRLAKQETEKLKNKLIKTNFETLKGQIDPHFMFNSLNVLSGLINIDAEKAHLFIDEFSQIYRYVLETIEKPLISLHKEVEFVKSYLFLQQIRYGKSLSYSIKINPTEYDFVLPPMSLQILIENAIKHNIVNESNPLFLEVYCKESHIYVRNNLQPKISSLTSTGLGLKNLKQRYELIGSDLKPRFLVESKHYTAILPIFDPEIEESSFFIFLNKLNFNNGSNNL